MPRETLTRDQIVQTAIDLLDAEGLEGLSMRRLGRHLGSATTAPYWHVKSKDDLVVLAGDAVFGEIELPDPDETGWRAAATAMAKDAYSMITRHPWLVPAMSTHLVYGHGKARFDDHAIAVFEAAGFVGVEADWAIHTVFTFVLGTALSEAADAAWRARVRREGNDEAEQIDAAMAQIKEVASQFPHLRTRMDVLDEVIGAEGADRGFDYGLRLIFDALEARLPGQEPG